jgi:ferredoxin
MLKISSGNSKLGKIPNVSLRPIKDCPNCKSCAKDCYALKAYRMYPGVRNAWDGNAKAVRKSGWEADADAYLTKHSPRFFRLHVAGDFISAKYFLAWVEIAKRHPETRFLAFTKAFDETAGVKLPGNFQVINSAFPGIHGLPLDKPIAFAGEPSEYTGRLAKRAEAAIVCPGKCDGCGMCWSLSSLNKDVRFPIH